MTSESDFHLGGLLVFMEEPSEFIGQEFSYCRQKQVDKLLRNCQKAYFWDTTVKTVIKIEIVALFVERKWNTGVKREEKG